MEIPIQRPPFKFIQGVSTRIQKIYWEEKDEMNGNDSIRHCLHFWKVNLCPGVLSCTKSHNVGYKSRLGQTRKPERGGV